MDVPGQSIWTCQNINKRLEKYEKMKISAVRMDSKRTVMFSNKSSSATLYNNGVECRLLE